jgi:hypothetical protein
MLNLVPKHFDVGIYQPRKPQAGGYFRCVQDHFEQLQMPWQGRYEGALLAMGSILSFLILRLQKSSIVSCIK